MSFGERGYLLDTKEAHFLVGGFGRQLDTDAGRPRYEPVDFGVTHDLAEGEKRRLYRRGRKLDAEGRDPRTHIARADARHAPLSWGVRRCSGVARARDRHDCTRGRGQQVRQGQFHGAGQGRGR